MTTVEDTPVAGGVAARVVDLTKVYGSGNAEVRALDGVSLDIAMGEFTAVMGPSGSGKSTLMHCCAALDTPTSGQIWLGDTELGGLHDKKLTLLRREEIGFVFQSFNLVPTLTARENILLPLSIAGQKPDPDLVRRGDRHDQAPRPARPPAQPALGWPAAAGRGAPGRWSAGRRSCSPTSRPATSTPARVRRC